MTAIFNYRHPDSRILESEVLAVEVMDPSNPIQYMSRRFSPVAFVLQAQYKDRPYLYSTEAAGAKYGFRGGMPMEFDLGERTLPPGYGEAGVGEPFLKIGVGILRKRSRPAYRFSGAYHIVEAARTDVDWQADSARFSQSLNGDANGYAYSMDTSLSLADNTITMTTSLRNTGSKSFTTEQYIHNFCAFNGEKLSRHYQVEFPYEFILVDSQNQPLADAPRRPFVKDNSVLRFDTSRKRGGKIWVVPPRDYKGENSLTLCHANGQRLTISASLPGSNTAVWVNSVNVSPEMNLMMSLQPAEEIRFTRTYAFRG